MKRLISVLAAVSICSALLVGCANSASSSAPASSSESTAVADSTPADSTADSSASASAQTATVDLDAIVSAIEAVNAVPNARAIDDFSLVNEMGLTQDNIVAFKGDVTNDSADCALVFAAEVKDGTADTVKSELEAYRDTMTGNLYAEFADKVAKATDARIVAKGNVVVMVIAGVNGPDYSAIDTAIDSVLA